MALIRQRPNLIISDTARPLSLVVKPRPITLRVTEENKVLEIGKGDGNGEGKVTLATTPEKIKLVTVYAAPGLRPIITPATVPFPQSITLLADGRISAYIAGSAPVGSDKNYVHNQLSASAIWIIQHNLGKRPAVQVYDSAGSEIFGMSRQDDPGGNTTTLTFSAEFSGKAYLN